MISDKTRQDTEAGFTLLELLVALAVLGMVMAVLFGGLRFGLRAWERGDAHAAGTDEVHVVQELLRRQIEQAYPYLVTQDPTRPHVDFAGAADHLELLGPAPLSLLDGGRARSRFISEMVDDHILLTLDARPELSSDKVAFTHEILLKRLKSVKFSYYGKDQPNADPEWHDRWEDKLELPQLIQLTVTFPDSDPRHWPEFVVKPKIAADVACVFDPLTKYCRGR